MIAVATMQAMVDLNDWLPDPDLRVRHRRETDADPAALWAAAQSVRLSEARMLGRLVRWRIPGLDSTTSFDELFTNPPFVVLEQGPQALVAGLVGKIWTLRRDYPALAGPEEFRSWSKRGTVRVAFANWVENDGRGVALNVEARVAAIGVEGRIGLAAVRPLVSSSHRLIASDGLEAAIRGVWR
jgi:hypothetical protein